MAGPITPLLDEEDISVIPSHNERHACFPRRFCYNLMHRAIEYQCILGKCPSQDGDRLQPTIGTRRLRSDDAQEASLIRLRLLVTGLTYHCRILLLGRGQGLKHPYICCTTLLLTLADHPSRRLGNLHSPYMRLNLRSPRMSVLMLLYPTLVAYPSAPH
jgi:hypothetical protein